MNKQFGIFYKDLKNPLFTGSFVKMFDLYTDSYLRFNKNYKLYSLRELKDA